MVQHKANGAAADQGAEINLCHGVLRRTQTHGRVTIHTR